MSGGSLFCFGLGYSAGFVARAAVRAGWRVRGTTRDTPTGGEEFSTDRFLRGQPLADGASALAGSTHVLISVPPDEFGCPVLDEHGADMAALAGLAWVGYLSTTNVYGDRGGGWVDESTPVLPSGERGRRRVHAEAGWLALQQRCGVPVHIFRLAGIYGPGRSALDALKNGTARRVSKPGQVFSRIHVEDLLAVLQASMAQPRPGAIYNVCDDEAAPPEDVITHAASLLGIAPPPLQDFAKAELSPLAKSFYDDNKHVVNQLIKEELGVRLRYPTYREGLAALLAAAS
jgi:nucleoside-diphosphate-sugar epimerase